MKPGFLLIYLGIREYAGKGIKGEKHLPVTLAAFSGTFAVLETIFPWAFRAAAEFFTPGIICLLTAWEACDRFKKTSRLSYIFASAVLLHGLFLTNFAWEGILPPPTGKGALGQNPSILRVIIFECIPAALSVNFS